MDSSRMASTHSSGVDQSLEERIDRLELQVQTLTLERNHWQQIAFTKAAGMKISEAMQVFSVSRRTIYNWIHEGKLKAWRTPGGQQRIDATALLDQNK